MDNQHLEQFRTAVGTWEDQRFVTQEELYAFAMFFLYLVNLGEAAGWVYERPLAPGGSSDEHVNSEGDN